MKIAIANSKLFTSIIKSSGFSYSVKNFKNLHHILYSYKIQTQSNSLIKTTCNIFKFKCMVYNIYAFSMSCTYKGIKISQNLNKFRAIQHNEFDLTYLKRFWDAKKAQFQGKYYLSFFVFFFGNSLRLSCCGETKWDL